MNVPLPHPDPVSLDLFDRRWVRIILFFLIPGAVFVLVSAGIKVSSLGIRHTIVIMAEDPLISDTPAAMRMTLIDDRKGFFLPQRLSAYLESDSRRHELFSGEVLDADYTVSRNFDVPSLATRNAVMELQVVFSNRRRTIRQPVRIARAHSTELLEFPSDVHPGRTGTRITTGQHRIGLFTEDRGAPGGLTSFFYIRTLDATGTAVSIPYALRLPSFTRQTETPLIEGHTGPAGLDRFAVTPLDLLFPIQVLAPTDTVFQNDTDANTDNNPDTETALQPKVLRPSVVYSGLRAEIDDPIVPHDRPLHLRISRISGAGPLYINVFHRGSWVQSETFFGGGHIDLALHLRSRGLLRLQITESPLEISRNIIVAHVYAMDETENPSLALNTLLGHLGDPDDQHWAKNLNIDTMTSEDRDLITAFTLSRLYEGHRPLPRWITSRPEDDAQLSAFQIRVRKGITAAICLLGLSVAAFIAVIARQSVGRQTRLSLMILSEDDPNISDLNDVQRLDRQQQRWNAIGITVLFGVVLSAFVSIALLVLTLSWS